METRETIDLIRRGDKEAIKMVYKENAKDIYSFAKSITGDHDLAMDATKKTFVDLFKNIQEGETPVNLRMAALKMVYDEACRIVLPSSDKIDSPFDRTETPAVVGDGIIDTEEELTGAIDEFFDDDRLEDEADAMADKFEEDAFFEGKVPEYADEEEQAGEEEPADPVSVTQVINIAEVHSDGDIVIRENEADDEWGDIQENVSVDPPKKRGITVVMIIINIILVLLLIWLLYGLLVNLKILPEIADLGYTWFNDTIYPIF
ncbi:MAG: RNA polymerase sigma factor [Lachnospiraceae bacterium]|jgi:hypothetical protein